MIILYQQLNNITGKMRIFHQYRTIQRNTEQILPVNAVCLIRNITDGLFNSHERFVKPFDMAAAVNESDKDLIKHVSASKDIACIALLSLFCDSKIKQAYAIKSVIISCYNALEHCNS